MPTAIRRTLRNLENNNFNPNDAGNTAPSTIPSQPGGQVQNTQNPNTPSTGSVQPPQSFDGNIPAQSFGYQSPNVNTTTPTAPPAGALQSRLDTALEERTTAAQSQEQQQGALEQRIRQLSDATLGRGEVIKQRSQEAGIDKATGELNDLLGLVSQKTSAYEKGQIQDQIDFSALEGTGQGIPQSLVRGRQARLQTQQQLRRQSDAVELNSLNRTAELMQGRITTAQQNIKDDVELEFGDKERALNQEMKFLERIDTKLASSKAEKLQFEIQKVQQERSDRENVLNTAITLAKNGAPQGLILAANKAKDLGELMTTPGVSRYLTSPLERLAIAEKGLSIQKLKQSMAESGAGGLSREDRDQILKDPTAKKAASRVAVIEGIKYYRDKVAEYRDSSGVVPPAKVAELNSILKTSIGSAINVAQDQGAMGDAEADRILGDLSFSRLKSTDRISGVANSIIGAQDTFLNSELAFIDSAIPNASNNFQLFADYKSQNQGVNDMFSGAINTSTPVQLQGDAITAY